MEEKVPEEVAKTYSRIAALRWLFFIALILLVLFGAPEYWRWVAIPFFLFLFYLMIKIGWQWLVYLIRTVSGK